MKNKQLDKPQYVAPAVLSILAIAGTIASLIYSPFELGLILCGVWILVFCGAVSDYQETKALYKAYKREILRADYWREQSSSIKNLT